MAKAHAAAEAALDGLRDSVLGLYAYTTDAERIVLAALRWAEAHSDSTRSLSSAERALLREARSWLRRGRPSASTLKRNLQVAKPLLASRTHH